MIKVVNTKTAYKDPFLEVILEDISVQKDKIIRNFSVVKKRSIVMIVAMTNKEQFLILNEYKFGSRKHMWTFPAGGLKKGEDPVISAKRELEEETGYSANTYEIVGVVYDYPSKDRHSVYIVKASGIRHKKKHSPEETEILSQKLVSKKKLMSMIKKNEFQITSALAAVLLVMNTF